MLYTTCLLCSLAAFTLWGVSSSSPIVRLDDATVVGITNARGTVESFLGIPFAKPPVKELRLRLPQLLTSYSGRIDATTFGYECYQQPSPPTPENIPPELAEDLTLVQAPFSTNANVTESEDCEGIRKASGIVVHLQERPGLNLNIIRPAGSSPSSKFPVLVWIYGGGFAAGANSVPAYNGTAIVQRSMDLHEPIIYVAINYRLHVLGFLGGREIRDAGVGNLGLQDQRTALRWIHKFISSFGGNPDKVTIWGQSAGAVSVALQMLTNRGNTGDLFRSAIMNSGGAIPTGDITDVQDTYNFVVNEVGCTGASDTLSCLRSVPVSVLVRTAGHLLTHGLSTPFMPRADGVFLDASPLGLVLAGQVAPVPFITGDVNDEGTLFSVDSLNVTTNSTFAAYVSEYWFPKSSVDDLNTLLKLYPSAPADGSPFGTGDANAWTPEFKRIAALQGDWFFNAPRRLLLDQVSSNQPTYSYLSVQEHFPGIGSAHGSDLLIVFGSTPNDMTDSYIRFVRNLDPNSRTDGVHWPTYDSVSRAGLQFNPQGVPSQIVYDTPRLANTRELTRLSLRFPI